MEKSFLNNSGMVMFEGVHSRSLSWTKRNYTCSFCKRQFNSAQALGGHMNVHRRDRARLRQLPSWVFQCHQNPNPNSSSSSSTSLPSCNSPNPTCRTKHHSFPSLLPHRETNGPIINSKIPQSGIGCFQSAEITIKKDSKVGMVDEVEGILMKKGFSRKYEMEKHMKNHELISLELEIGCKDPDEVLDLELRLGYV